MDNVRAAAWTDQKIMVVLPGANVIGLLDIVGMASDAMLMCGQSPDRWESMKLGTVGQFSDDGGRSWRVFKYDDTTRRVHEVSGTAWFDSTSPPS